MKENHEFRALAREQLAGNWKNSVIIVLVYFAIFMVIGFIPFLGSLVTLVIAGPLVLGLYKFFLKMARKEAASVEDLFSGFHLFQTAFVLYLLQGIFIFLWTLLLVIPGIIATLNYSQAYFILNDHPEMKATEVLQQSKTMMTGHKMEFFLLALSFIGWMILAAIPFGLGFLWLTPYMQTAFANFYEEIKGSYSINPNQAKLNGETVSYK